MCTKKAFNKDLKTCPFLEGSENVVLQQVLGQ